MFDLAQAVGEWRRQMQLAGITDAESLEELEGHLRDDVERKVRLGWGESAAFAAAVEQFGSVSSLKEEFSKNDGRFGDAVRRFVLTLTGVLQPITNMNMSTPNLESRWATYLKAAAIALPALFLWLFSCVFLVPKLQEMSRQAGTSLFKMPEAPGIFRAFAAIGEALFFLTQHGLLVIGALVLTFVMLEWRSSGWARYRKTTVRLGAFLLNLTVMISITLLVIVAILVAPGFQHIK